MLQHIAFYLPWVNSRLDPIFDPIFRGEIKFAGPAELAKQISKDISTAKKVLATTEKDFLLSCVDKFNR